MSEACHIICLVLLILMADPFKRSYHLVCGLSIIQLTETNWWLVKWILSYLSNLHAILEVQINVTLTSYNMLSPPENLLELLHCDPSRVPPGRQRIKTNIPLSSCWLKLKTMTICFSPADDLRHVRLSGILSENSSRGRNFAFWHRSALVAVVGEYLLSRGKRSCKHSTSSRSGNWCH